MATTATGSPSIAVLLADVDGTVVTNEKVIAPRATEAVKRWRKIVKRRVVRFTSALLLDETLIGGGNAKKLKEAPRGCRLGPNANAFIGGFRMWEPGNARTSHSPQRSPYHQARKAKGTRR
jgi:hypothetical protein